MVWDIHLEICIRKSVLVQFALRRQYCSQLVSLLQVSCVIFLSLMFELLDSIMDISSAYCSGVPLTCISISLINKLNRVGDRTLP